MTKIIKLERPIVSIIIPTYNRSKKLKRALHSIVAQTFDDWEVVIVDNNSTDDTDEMLRDFKGHPIRIYKIRNNGIIASSRNLGIRKSTGDWIAFLDSDDWWHINKLKVIMKNCNSKYDFFYHDLQIIKSRIRMPLYKKKVNSCQARKPIYDNLIKYGNVIANSSVVVRKDLILQIGGLSENPQLIASEDYDCWLRLSKVTDRFMYIPETLGFYEVNKENTSGARLSLINLGCINALHINPFILKHGMETPIWWQYNFARALYKTYETVRARKILQKLFKRDLSWSMRVKVLYMLSF